MRNAKGKIELSYNPQVTADKKGFILASDVSQQSFDAWNLQPQVKQTEKNLGDLPAGLIWSFDSGRYNIWCFILQVDRSDAFFHNGINYYSSLNKPVKKAFHGSGSSAVETKSKFIEIV